MSTTSTRFTEAAWANSDRCIIYHHKNEISKLALGRIQHLERILWRFQGTDGARLGRNISLGRLILTPSADIVFVFPGALALGFADDRCGNFSSFGCIKCAALLEPVFMERGLTFRSAEVAAK